MVNIPWNPFALCTVPVSQKWQDLCSSAQTEQISICAVCAPQEFYDRLSLIFLTEFHGNLTESDMNKGWIKISGPGSLDT